jgi:hypothetical protein
MVLNKRSWTPLLALFAGLCVPILQAQVTQDATDPLVQELTDARGKFGIALKDGEPFHLKLHLETFDENGKPNGSGTPAIGEEPVACAAFG